VMKLLATEVDVTIGHMGITNLADLFAGRSSLLRRRGAMTPPFEWRPETLSASANRRWRNN